ncbi:MAG: hypothetical protein WCP69_12355 [Bacteroidota bacterium]
MKSKIMLSTVVALLLAIPFASIAQKTKRAPKAVRKTVEKALIVTGQVAGWVNNDDFVYDGLNLQTTNGIFLVKFPTTKGLQLTSAVQIGNTITVNGFEVVLTQGEKAIKPIGISFNGKNVFDSIPLLPAVAHKKENIYSKGKIVELQKDKQGNLKGLILDNKIILRVPKSFSEQFVKEAVVARIVSFSGVKQILRNGEVAAVSYTIIRCKTITINGKQYLTK